MLFKPIYGEGSFDIWLVNTKKGGKIVQVFKKDLCEQI